MSLGHGASIVRDGLVFCYDQGNIDRSWKGAPATNLISSSGIDCSVLSSYTSLTVTRVVDTNSLSGYAMQQQVAVVGINSAGRASFGDATNIPTSGNAYVSVYAKRYNSGTNITPKVYSGANWYTLEPLDGGGQYLTDQYRRFGVYCVLGTTSSGPNPAFSMVQGGDVNDTTTITRWHSPQVELNTFATPFVNGTRSNTQALLDLTRNNIITATSLTYASDGSFSFNGSNNVIVISGPASSFFTDFSQPITLSTWIRVPADATWTNGFAGNILSRSSYAGSVGLWRNTVNNEILAYFRQAGTTFGAVACTGTIERDLWVNIVASWTGSSLSLYLNGVLSQTNTGALGGANIADWTIGSITAAGGNVGNRFQGEVGITQIYNKALTAAEVKQNFEAIRGRYGI